MRIELNVGGFLDRAAFVAGDRIAVVDEPGAPGSLGTVTYGSLARRAAALAARLDALGVPEGARVAIVSPNSARFLISYFGVSGYGRVLVPINYRLNAQEVGFIVGHSGAQVVLYDPEFASLVDELDVAHLVALDGVADAAWFDDAVGRPAPRTTTSTRMRPARSTTPRARRRAPRACSSPIATAG